MQRLFGFLRLTRPANIVTAVSDILAGLALAGYITGVPGVSTPALLLILATIGLYGGGVVLNDVFDAKLDSRERPERPIPSGLISVKEAAVFGVVLLCAGIAAAAACAVYPSGMLALAIAAAAVVYDKWGKHHAFFGPLNMGLCRGLNLLLGMSIVPAALLQHAYVAVVPVVYIAAITMISRGEVHGGKSRTMVVAAVLYGLVMAGILFMAYTKGYLWHTLFFIALLAALIFPPLIRAAREPAGKNIGKAVKAGVIALIVMNAAWAAAVGALPTALVTALLLPVSILLARLFAVT